MTAAPNRLPVLFIILVLAASTLSCQFLTGGQLSPTAIPSISSAPTKTSTVKPSIQASTSIPPESSHNVPPQGAPDTCPSGDCIEGCMASIVDTELDYLGKEGKIDENFYPEESLVLVSYLVEGNGIMQYFSNNDIPAWLKPYRDDFDYHLGLWHVISVLLPDSIRPYVKEFNITTDGVDEILASTYQSETDINSWVLDVDILDTRDLDYFLSTIIHEFSHLITLNPSQVTPNEAVFDNPDNSAVYEKEAAACPTYFPDACSHPDSYINLFYDRFWKDADFYSRWEKINAMDYGAKYDNAMSRFYKDYQDQFVSEYAATNIDEDMAESFTLFILDPKPAGKNIAEQKVLFFYDFPEMINIRKEIAGALCELTVE